MISSEWKKVDFNQFINDFSIKPIIENAPIILYSKKDKEHEAINSLITFFFIAGGCLIYIALVLLLIPKFASTISFYIILCISSIGAGCLLYNYIKSNVYIKPFECWVEIFQGKAQENNNFYCFSYYPIFTGACHPNKAKNLIYKLYQEEILKSKIDISQIEVYSKLIEKNQNQFKIIGYFFQYGEGKPFKEEKIEQNIWKYFPFEKSDKENYIAVANWGHQFEWRRDLGLDYDKLHGYAPWVIQRWNELNLKPLTDEYKKKIRWSLRNIESLPKLKPWEGNLEKQTYKNPKANSIFKIIDDAIKNVISNDIVVEKVKDIEKDLFKFKAYFRDLNEKNLRAHL
ncbi:MAG: hypothetical protein ACTSQJ_07355 [Promethearchaeota archaeon]